MAVGPRLPSMATGAGRVSPGQGSRTQSEPLILPLLLQSAFLDTMELAVSSAAVALTGAHVTGLQATASAQLAGLGTSVRAVSGFWEAGRFCQGWLSLTPC